MKKIDPSLLESLLTSRMSRDLAEHNLSGASLIVLQNGAPVFRGHFGTTGPDTDTPIGESTLYRLASMTKPVTAVGILTLYDRSLIDLYDPVERYLPEYADPWLAEVKDGEIRSVRPLTVKPTILHLLTHTSGLLGGELTGACWPHRVGEINRTLENAVRWYAEMGFGFEPFSRTEYSGEAAFDVLARIVEIAADMPYADYLKQAVFDPCGMADATFSPTEDQWSRMAAMHDKKDGQSVAVALPAGCVFGITPVTHPLGGAGLASTLADYAAFGEMLCRGGVIGGNRVLSELAVRLMSVPHVPKSIMPGPVQWGLGVRVITGEDYPYRLSVGAFGWSGAYGTHFWIDPANGITAVYLKNTVNDGGSDCLTGKNFERDVMASLA